MLPFCNNLEHMVGSRMIHLLVRTRLDMIRSSSHANVEQIWRQHMDDNNYQHTSPYRYDWKPEWMNECIY